MKVYDIDIVVTHRVRYIADDWQTAEKCAEFDYMNQSCADDLWLCEDVKSTWDTEFAGVNSLKNIKDKPSPRDAKEYDLKNFNPEYGE